MFSIYYYKDSKGNMPVRNYIDDLATKRDKSSHIKYSKILDYIKVLSEKGTTVGVPYTKHIDGDIWELRPIRDRILFAAWDENEQGFVLLHQFMKQTRKTPQKEIDIAMRRLQELREVKNDE
jgi:phage-related protein